MQPSIKQIAKKVRLWAEEYAQTHKYPKDLTGLCAIAATKLLMALKEECYSDAVIIENFEHAFVMVGDTVVDVTATQFNRDKVIVMDKKFVSSDESWWQTENIFKDPTAFMAFQNKSWAKSQRVTPEKLEC